MKISIVTVLLGALTSVITAKTLKDVLIDAIKTDTDTQTLNATILAYQNRNNDQALADAYKVLLSDWNQITNDTNNVAPVVYNDAVADSFYFNYTVYNSTFNQLTSVVFKKQTFINNGILTSVCDSGKSLNISIFNAFNALIAKYPAGPGNNIKLWGMNTQTLYKNIYNKQLSALGCP